MEKLIDTKNTLMATRYDIIWKGLFKNKFQVSPKYIPQVLLALFMSGVLLPFTIGESLYYRNKIKTSPVKKPIFILGHWRTGTTLLQNLISKDPETAFLDPMSGYSHNTALMRAILKGSIDSMLAEVRVMDNMEYKVDLPLEEYVVFSTCYHNAMWEMNIYPKSRDMYMDYAFVDELPEKQKKGWLKNYDKMLRKITYRTGGKSLVLKSPDATARALLLKETYPDAKFINIYRNPYAVVRSSINMYQKMFRVWGIQEVPSYDEIEEFVIKGFKRMYLKYFSDLQKIPKEDIIEFKFEEFEKNPMPLLENAYRQFGWNYDAAKPEIQKFWDSLAGYKKNDFDYPDELISKVNEELGFYFEHYGYEKQNV